MVDISVHGGFGRPPKPLTSEAEKLFELVKAAGAGPRQPSPGNRPAGFANGTTIAACGVPVVDTMGVRGGQDS